MSKFTYNDMWRYFQSVRRYHVAEEPSMLVAEELRLRAHNYGWNNNYTSVIKKRS